MNTTPQGPQISALGEFNIPLNAAKLAEQIAETGAVLDGVESSAGKSFGNDPEAFVEVAEGIGTLAKKAQGVSVTGPDAFNPESGATTTVIHDPATLIAATTTVTKVSAGGGIETIGEVDEKYKPNYEGPAWSNKIT